MQNKKRYSREAPELSTETLVREVKKEIDKEGGEYIGAEWIGAELISSEFGKLEKGKIYPLKEEVAIKADGFKPIYK